MAVDPVALANEIKQALDSKFGASAGPVDVGRQKTADAIAVPVAQAINTITPGGGSASTAVLIDASVLATDDVGDLVYVSGAPVGGLFTTTKANPFDKTKMPAVGMVLSKSSPTVAKVILSGVITGLYIGLIPNKVYFVDPSARLSATPPVGGTRYVQQVGVALSSSSFFFNPSLDLKVLR
jgi:hypothetical protein